MHRFAQKIIVVTGAASGIGRATALRLHAEGAQVIAIDRDAAGLATLDTVATTILLDLTDASAVLATMTAIPQIDGLCNAAGGSGRRFGDGPVGECTLAGWHATLDMNLTSQFVMSKACLPQLLASRGAIVNVASVLGLVGGDADFATHAYAASKAGVIGLSRAMAAFYAPQGLRVNVIAPGLIATPMSQRAQQNDHIRTRLTQLQPLTGDFGSADDVAAAAAYLLSHDAKFVTGTVLAVDGGWTTY